MESNFSSVDRLIELGMGLAMSNQIAQSMNTMMAQMAVPPQMVKTNIKTTESAEIQKSALNTEVAAAEVYYAAIDGKQLGPYKGTEIALLIFGKKIKADTLIWKSGTKDWVKAETYEDLKNLLQIIPPEING